MNAVALEDSAVGLITMPDPVYLSVKIREDVYRMVKALAGWHGQPVGEYLSNMVEPIAVREMAKMSKEASHRPEKDGGK